MRPARQGGDDVRLEHFSRLFDDHDSWMHALQQLPVLGCTCRRHANHPSLPQYLIQVCRTRCRQIKVAATDAAALGPFKKYAHGHGRENEKSLLCFGAGWYNFGKIVKTVVIRCHILKLKCTKFDFGWALPQTPLTALPQTP